MLGYFFLTQMLGSACWVILLGCFYIFTQVLGYIFFNLNAGFNLLGHFIGLFLICITHVLGSFSVTKLLGYFFSTQPLVWACLEWNNPAAELQSECGLFESSTGERSSQCRRIGALLQRNKGLYTFNFIYKVFAVL